MELSQLSCLSKSKKCFLFYLVIDGANEKEKTNTNLELLSAEKVSLNKIPHAFSQISRTVIDNRGRHHFQFYH